ncbi:MAG: 50S ribosomal protein L23 [Lactobacillales bacterium]|jgi:large subunit ribosomal protein L23|nr:50S ribosomal protein L23 [Lactobacillales bacterium]
MSILDIIKRPVITESSVAAMEENKYTFEVATTANKTLVKQAVEVAFPGVKVAKVNILNVKPKFKRMGKHAGYTNKRRKAIVTLSEGSIQLFAEAE